MKELSPTQRLYISFFIGVLIIIGLIWANFRFASQNPGGNDFIPRWLATQNFLKSGESPYSPETTLSIQEFFYDRPAQGEEDWQLFVYPHYAMLVFAPFSLVEEYNLARAVWMTTLELATIAILGLSFLVLKSKPRLHIAAGLLVFWLLGYHGVRPIINGNASIIVSLFIILTFFAINNGADRMGGAILALTTIKPQMVILLVPLILVWSLSHKRFGIWVGFASGMAILVGGSLIFQRDWMIQNAIQILQYPLYTEPGSPGQIMAVWWPAAGQQVGLITSVIAGLVLLWEWVVSWGKRFEWFFWTACLTLALTNFIGVRTATANFTALIPATVLVVAAWDRRRGERANRSMLVVLLVWFFGLWALFIATVEIGAGGQPIQSPLLFFPFPLVVIGGLYWVRWWVLRPRQDLVGRHPSYLMAE